MQNIEIIVIDDIAAVDNNVTLYCKAENTWSSAFDKVESMSHGNNVLSIIAQNYKKNITAFNVFADGKKSYLKNLISALEFIYTNFNPKYIQMSIGVMGHSSELEHACRRLYERGTIFIAAFNNNGAISYPAAYDFVIGVASDEFLNINTLRFGEYEIVDIFAKSSLNINIDNNFKLAYGSSYSACIVTSKLLTSGKNFKTKKEAIKYLKESQLSNKPIKKCAIFPYNKENKNIVHNIGEFIYELVKVYDTKFSPMCNQKIQDFKRKKTFIVENIEKCDWTSFDTLIIGHVESLSKLLGYNCKRWLMEKCLIHGKNVICYDNYWIEEYIEQFETKQLKLISADAYSHESTYGKLYQFRTPIINIIGTSSKQCKFTLQLQVKDILKQKGYNVGFLSTEPNGKLLGADVALPIGYNSSINKYTANQIIEIINAKLFTVDQMDKDVIILGGQSAVLPRYFYNTGQINVNQYSYLLSTLSDVYVLCVNWFDDLSLIERSINFVESICTARIIFLCLSPLKNLSNGVLSQNIEYLSDLEIKSIVSRLEKKFNLTVIIAGERSQDEIIYQTIEKAFTGEINE